MRHGSLFSGLGGFDLAAEWMGWENVFHCEINPFGRKILNHYWPTAISYEDIKTTDFKKHNGAIDIISGGFPCQPYSTAGKRKGTRDDRHLWPEMLRAIREVRPRWILGENVRGLTNWNGGVVFDQVQADLEAEGYEVLPFLLPACAVGAPHRRDRIWIVAFNPNNRGCGRNGAKQEFFREEQSPNSIRICTRSIAHPQGIRERSGAEEQGSDETGGKQLEGPESGRYGDDNGTSGIDTNPDQQRLQKRYDQQNGRRSQSITQRFSGITDWQDFPTKPPIRCRNDGLSTGLVFDSISEAKHRNESIKGFGNAVVPQLVFQIFKAIEQYETLAKGRQGSDK